MKRTNIHIFAVLALLLGLAACTQDEAGFLPKGAEGTSIVFTATGLNPAATAIAGTRAPVDGNWEGVQSVAVLMDGTVKAYDVTPSTAAPTSATLTSTDPYYWTNHNDITVTAWWPYTAGETTPPAVKVKANQSAQKDFEGSDLIVANGQTVTYGSPTLRFTHRTARVAIVLTDYTEGLASVQLTGLSTEGDNPDIIVPYDKGSNTYTALVAPQSVAAGTAFVTCTFTNGKTFVYKMKNAADWQAGGEYTYTVSLAAAKDLGYTIESNGSYTVISADGLMNVAELVNGGKSDINITLDTDIDLTGKDWTPIGKDYDNSYKGTFDGGGHTITGLTFTTNDKYAGLFGWLNKAGTVKNVVMEGVQITSNQIYGGSIGGVAGYSWGTIENCSVSGMRAADGAGDAAFPPVVGGKRQLPVPEPIVQSREVIERCAGAFENVAPLVFPEILLQGKDGAGARHELPQARGFGVGESFGLKGAFNERKQRQFRGHAAGFDFFHDVVEVFAGAVGHPAEIIRVSRILFQRVSPAGRVEGRQRKSSADPIPDVGRSIVARGIAAFGGGLIV